MVRYEGQSDICTYVIPYGAPATLAGWTDQNFIDTLATEKFRELGIEPSGLCDDATFLRRIFLDATGTLPTADEIQEFAADADPQKRSKWIDRVLGLSDHPHGGAREPSLGDDLRGAPANLLPSLLAEHSLRHGTNLFPRPDLHGTPEGCVGSVPPRLL